ncbi:hypothetical protein NDU88_004421 [Pleurodeles waltl]|uniref:Uncharacterized protein n=1 Tax=Pleurodeles waltl TaxID=8319 RepID=A0AAV7MV36_PLEWA|nr:hypothetical protein NDU88_004421 [Pleurodeles waltl]
MHLRVLNFSLGFRLCLVAVHHGRALNTAARVLQGSGAALKPRAAMFGNREAMAEQGARAGARGLSVRQDLK